MRPLQSQKCRRLKEKDISPAPLAEKRLRGRMWAAWRSLSSSFRKHMAFDLFRSNLHFRVFSLGITWMMLGFVVPLVFLVPYATDNGMEPSRAALLLSVLGFINIFVRPPAGILFSMPWFKGRHVYVFSGALLLNGLSNSICCISASFSVLLAYVISYGLSMSMVGSLMFTVLMDTVEMSQFPSALGLLSIMESVTLLIGPPLAGWLVDSTGLYTYMFVACSITVASSAIFLIVSFYWLDWRDASQEKLSAHSSKTHDVISASDTQHIPVSAGQKDRQSVIETEHVTTV